VAEQPQDAQNVIVEAIGEPGQRRFRLITLANGQTTIAWMEKQQLDVLGRALLQVLEQIPSGISEQISPILSGDFDLSTRHQFRVGRIELGFDPGRDRLVLVVRDLEDGEGDKEISLTALLSRQQARVVGEEAARVVAEGRPRCVLCGAVMGPGAHMCVEQNGHLPDELTNIGLEDD